MADDERDRADRRQKTDRRTGAAAYDGEERRKGAERRGGFEARQGARIRKEKLRFLNATTVSAGLMTAAVVWAAFFMLAPEIREAEENALRVRIMEARITELNRQVAAAQTAERKNSFGGALSRGIGSAQEAAGAAAEQVSEAAGRAVAVVAPVAGVDDLLQLLTGVQELSRTPEGRMALAVAVSRLRGAVEAEGNDPGASLALAVRQDPSLQALLGNVSDDHLGAAALLLALDDLRRRSARHEGFADSLAVAAKLAGSDPVVKAALLRLAPYAAAGVVGPGILQQQLAARAAEIALAGLEKDESGDSLAERAGRELSRFVTVRPATDDPEAPGAAGAVARAQLRLGSGDVAGALSEMRGLSGPAAAAAGPWMEQAAGAVAAHDAESLLGQAILQVLSAAAESGNFSLEGIVSILKRNVEALIPAQGGTPYLSPALQGPERPGLPGFQ